MPQVWGSIANSSYNGYTKFSLKINHIWTKLIFNNTLIATFSMLFYLDDAAVQWHIKKLAWVAESF